MNTFKAGTKIFMGSHSISDTFGRPVQKIFVVTDRFMVESGKLDYVTDRLKAEGVEYVVYSDVTPDPDIKLITKGVEQFAEFGPDGMVAFGGGSPIDAAKAIRFFARKAYGSLDCPFVAIPTTSGTGSEVTKFSVISDGEKHIKYPLIEDSLVPDVAILDAALITSVPPVVTADTGIDVLTHAIEAYVSLNHNDFSDAAAEKAIHLVLKNLPAAYHNPEDLEARQAMHNASCLAGIAFNNAGLGLNHGMAHILGARLKLSHGRANGILLPYVMSFNAGCGGPTEKLNPVADRYARLSELLGLGAISVRQSDVNLIRTIKNLVKSLGIPSSISKLGVNEKEFEAMVEEMGQIAVADSCTATNPTPCTPAQVAQVFLKAYHGKYQ